MENKRRLVRFQVPFYVKYRLLPQARQFSGVAQDISMGGARLAVEERCEIAPCRDVEIYFLLPSKTLSVSAAVAWCATEAEGVVCGVKFNPLSAATREAIYNHIITHHRKELTDKWWKL